VARPKKLFEVFLAGYFSGGKRRQGQDRERDGGDGDDAKLFLFIRAFNKKCEISAR